MARLGPVFGLLAFGGLGGLGGARFALGRADAFPDDLRGNSGAAAVPKIGGSIRRLCLPGHHCVGPHLRCIEHYSSPALFSLRCVLGWPFRARLGTYNECKGASEICLGRNCGFGGLHHGDHQHFHDPGLPPDEAARTEAPVTRPSDRR